MTLIILLLIVASMCNFYVHKYMSTLIDIYLYKHIFIQNIVYNKFVAENVK
jgi:hypothetical protein